MTRKDYTNLCLAIFKEAAKTIPAAYRSQLIHDTIAKPDKPGRKTLMFSVWGKPHFGFWHRGYSSYSIVHDPFKELSEITSFQVRFVYFHSRKENGMGSHKKRVYSALKSLHGERGFEFSTNHKTFRVFKRYDSPTATRKWQRAASVDLAWLVAWTLPAFAQMLGSNKKA